MHVMVYSLAADSRGSFLGVPGLMGGGGMLKSAELGSYSGLGVLVVLMSEFLVLDWDHVMLVLLGQRLLVGDRLDGSVIMVLVNITVHCLRDFLMSVREDVLLCHGRVHDLVDGGFVASVRGELVNGGLSGFHDEDKLIIEIWMV